MEKRARKRKFHELSSPGNKKITNFFQSVDSNTSKSQVPEEDCASGKVNSSSRNRLEIGNKTPVKLDEEILQWNTQSPQKIDTASKVIECNVSSSSIINGSSKCKIENRMKKAVKLNEETKQRKSKNPQKVYAGKTIVESEDSRQINGSSRCKIDDGKKTPVKLHKESKKRRCKNQHKVNAAKNIVESDVSSSRKKKLVKKKMGSRDLEKVSPGETLRKGDMESPKLKDKINYAESLMNFIYRTPRKEDSVKKLVDKEPKVSINKDKKSQEKNKNCHEHSAANPKCESSLKCCDISRKSGDLSVEKFTTIKLNDSDLKSKELMPDLKEYNNENMAKELKIVKKSKYRKRKGDSSGGSTSRERSRSSKGCSPTKHSSILRYLSPSKESRIEGVEKPKVKKVKSRNLERKMNSLDGWLADNKVKTMEVRKYGMKLPNFNSIMQNRQRRRKYSQLLKEACDIIGDEIDDAPSVPVIKNGLEVSQESLNCNHLSLREIEQHFNSFIADCRKIINGEVHHERHEKYMNRVKNSTVSANFLIYNISTLAFTIEQKKRLASLCEEHFDDCDLYNHTQYYFKVLIPELCLRIFMEVHDMDHECAIEYLQNMPIPEV